MNEPTKVKYTELIEVEKNIEPDYYVVAQYLHAFYLTVVPEYRCGSISSIVRAGPINIIGYAVTL